MKEFIEKLIGRLEEKSVEITFPLYPNDSTSFVPLTEAISIVKQLAEEYNGDFCEWKKENSNKYVCNAHAEIHDSRVLDWCVCPYCGKEIKVVE